MTAPILVFGWGNPSRGDDALGPLFVERIAALDLSGVECLTDFQLQVEHALDLEERQLVLFVDASLDAEPPFAVNRLSPVGDTGISTHALTPEAVMQVYIELQDREPPPCYLLGIRGTAFELGAALTPAAHAHLVSACEWAKSWLSRDGGVNLSSTGELI
jgi:hydrogenase maturation protease